MFLLTNSKKWITHKTTRQVQILSIPEEKRDYHLIVASNLAGPLSPSTRLYEEFC